MDKKYFRLLPWICLIGLFCFLSAFMWKYGDCLTDSDISSEMILAKLLTEENSIITKNWYYSTELRVLNIQMIYSFFFRFFSDWTVIRVASCMVSYLMMLASYYYLLYQMGYKKYFAISAIFLLLPISDGYFEYVLLALLYATFISSSFLTVGMMFHYENSSKYIKRLLLVVMIILALASGMGGARHVVILYLPMLLAASIMSVVKKKPTGYLICAAANFIASGIGYLINAKVLAKSYHFTTWGGLSWRKFSFDGFFDILFGTLRALGYSYGDIKTPVASSFSCFLLVVMVLCIFRSVSNKRKTSDKTWLLSMYILCAFIVFGGIYTFTNMLYADRYGMSVIVFAIPIIFIYICEAEWNRCLKVILGIVLTGGILASSMLRYDRYSKLDKTEELRQISDYLVKEQEISVGYATFWNGNVLTELSNGFIDVYCWVDNVAELANVDKLLPWLQVTSHELNKPEGRLFLLFTKDEYEVCTLKPFLDEENASFSSNNYIVFIFESYEDLVQEMHY